MVWPGSARGRGADFRERGGFHRFFLVGLVLVCLGCGADNGVTPSGAVEDSQAEDPQAEDPRSVLIVSVDTLRYDSLGFSGARGATVTPNLDRLAAGGITFSNAVAPMPRTTPSLGSLLTGRWPQNHGSREVGDPILSEVETLAETLRAKGLHTAGVSVNDSAGRQQGLARGFESFIGYRDLLALYGDRLYYEGSPVEPGGIGWAAATTEQTLQLAATLDPNHPFLLWVFFFDPHFVYRPPSPFQDGVEASQCWELYDHYSTRLHLGGEIFADIGGVASAALDHCRRLYEAEVRYTDQQIGLLLRRLEERGLLENTLIVFTADHGENFGEDGLYFEHGDNAHDAGLHVPLVFSGPGVVSERLDPTAVSLVDVAPTILDWLGIEAPLGADGGSLLTRLTGEQMASPDRIVFAESASALLNEAREPLITGRLGGRVCVNHEGSTLCREPGREKSRGKSPEDARDDGGGDGPEGETWTFFDRSVDPGMRVDRLGSRPEVEQELAAALDRWPAESARERVARTARFKLVQFPRLEGGYRSELYDLTGRGEGVDVSAEYPRVLEVLEEALVDWAAGIPREVQRQADEEREQILRNLGYIR